MQLSDQASRIRSLPTRERGLKLCIHALQWYRGVVAPHAGAWIETLIILSMQFKEGSLPTRERGLKLFFADSHLVHRWSLPTRERGLKHLMRIQVGSQSGGRSPRGSVD